MKGGRFERNNSGHHSSKSGEWQHDKFQETENSKNYNKGFNSGGNSSQNYRHHKSNSGTNHGSKGGGKGNADTGMAWTHDKFDSFEKGFGMKRNNNEFKKKHFQKKDSTRDNDHTDKKSDYKRVQYKEKISVKIKKYGGDHKKFDSIILNSKPSEKQDIVIYNKLDKMLSKSNLSRKQKLKTKIAVVSQAMKKFPDGRNKLKSLLNYLIREYVQAEESYNSSSHYKSNYDRRDNKRQNGRKPVGDL